MMFNENYSGDPGTKIPDAFTYPGEDNIISIPQIVNSDATLGILIPPLFSIRSFDTPRSSSDSWRVLRAYF